MEIRRQPPRYPRGGPSCLLFLVLISVAIVAGYIFVNRATVIDAIVPDPTLVPTKSPASYAVRAELFKKDGEYDKAIEAWQSAVALAPNNTAYYKPLINLLVQQKRSAEALELAQKANELLPANDDLWVATSSAYLRYAWDLADAGKDAEETYARAVEAARAAIKINPTNAEAYAYLTGGLIGLGSDFLPEAREMSMIAYGLEPENPIVLYNSAQALINEGYYDTAQKYLELALEYDKTHQSIDTYTSLARLYYFDSGAQKAILLIKDALEYNPENPELYDTLAYFYILAGAYPQAEENAKLAVQFAPNMARAHARYGYALFKNNNNYKAAIPELTKAIEMYEAPNENTALYFVLLGVAQLYLDSKNCSIAIPLFESSLEVALPDSPAKLNAEEGIKLCREAGELP